MITSTDLQKLTNDFVRSGGKIEKHEIIIRDYANPNGGFMMTSANDAPKRTITENLKARKKRKHSYKQRNKAIEVMRAHTSLSIDEIADMAGVSQTTAREAIKHINYQPKRLSTARPPVMRELILAHADNTKTASELAEQLGTTPSYVFRTCSLNGIELKRQADELTDLEKSILAIKTWAYTAKEIGAMAGCTEQHARAVCKKHGYKVKSGVRNYDRRTTKDD